MGALTEPDGHEVVHLRDRFSPNTKDIDWISDLGQEGEWVVISADLRITKNKHEREAWRQAAITIFFFAKGWQNQDFWEQSWRLVRWWPRIAEQAELVQPGAAFQIPLSYKSGKFKQLS